MFLCKAIASRLQVGLRGHSPCKATQNIAMLQTNRLFNVRRVTWRPLLAYRKREDGRSGIAAQACPCLSHSSSQGGDHIRPKDCSQIDVHESPFLLPEGKKRVDKSAFPIFLFKFVLKFPSSATLPRARPRHHGLRLPPRETAQWRRSPQSAGVSVVQKTRINPCQQLI